MEVWKPGRDLAIDEIMVRYKGRAKETTTVPNKPTPTGFKVWAVAQRGSCYAGTGMYLETKMAQ
jgi:hypothetical protein